MRTILDKFYEFIVIVLPPLVLYFGLKVAFVKCCLECQVLRMSALKIESKDKSLEVGSFQGHPTPLLTLCQP